jgi:adenylate kinase
VYNDQTKPVADYYQQQGKLTEINGEHTIEEVFAALCAVMNGL